MLIHTKCMDFFKELSVQKQIHWPLTAKLTERKNSGDVHSQISVDNIITVDGE